MFSVGWIRRLRENANFQFVSKINRNDEYCELDCKFEGPKPPYPSPDSVKMTSITPVSVSTSPVITPEANEPRSSVVLGETNVSIKHEIWRDRKQCGHIAPVEPAQRPNINRTENTSEANASLDFESMSGSRGGANAFGEPEAGEVLPNYLRWAVGSNVLLEDEEGIRLFEKYLKQEDPDRLLMLEFWLALNGVDEQLDKLKKYENEKEAEKNNEKEAEKNNNDEEESIAKVKKIETQQNRTRILIQNFMKVIYTHQFVKIDVSPDIKKAVMKVFESKQKNREPLPVTLFDDARAYVKKVVDDIVYPNFLQSELYLSYVQKMQEEAGISPGTPREAPATREDVSSDEGALADEPETPNDYIINELAVVNEDEELELPSVVLPPPPPYRRRAPPDVFSVRYAQQHNFNRPSYPYHTGRRLNHCSYNPVSRQDSELQSLSSDARTDSMSDVSFCSDDMNTMKDTYAHKRQQQRMLRQMKENASINQHTHLHCKVIPRTSHPQSKELAKPPDPAAFAKELTSRLEKVAQEREKEVVEKEKTKLLAHKLSLCDDEKALPPYSNVSQQFVDVMMQKMEDDEQSILDQHVSRVWSDDTPKRSPKNIGTPVRPKSPDGRKFWSSHVPNKMPPQMARVPHPYVGSGPVIRKAKDAYSFTTDSGNGTDTERHSRSLTKSKSTPEYVDQRSESYFPGYCQRPANRNWSSSRKTLTDSGVSVMSGGHVENVAPSLQSKERMVTSWVLEHDRNMPMKSSFSSFCEERDSTMSSSSKHKMRSSMGGSIHNSTRSKAGGITNVSNVKIVQPAQPFVADPKMPPLPYHAIDYQGRLEEACRKLNEHKDNQSSDITGGSDYSNHGSMYQPSVSRSDVPHRPTSLTKSRTNEETTYTVVMYNFNDEQVPYRLKIPGNPITFKQFKEYMPKKGQYRCFFMSPCEEPGIQQIQEEITDDNQYLPLWKGKVMAQIKAVE